MNKKEMHKVFLFEAIKITLFCVVSTMLFFSLGVKQNILLILFNMAVMSCVATFSPNKKHLVCVLEGGLVIIVSIILGGVLGFYLPNSASLLTILYAILAFLIPKTREQTNIFATGALMFLIFTSLPFKLEIGMQLSLYGIILLPVILGFYWIFDRKLYSDKIRQSEASNSRVFSATVVGIALCGAWVISKFLQHYTTINHLYWIGLTILVVIQGAKQRTIKTSIVRIGVNTLGALIIILMTNVVPPDFWVNMVLLTLILFCIFALGYSYVGRTIFIELFILWFAHVLGQYQNIIAINRVFLTLIGGGLVIGATLILQISYFKKHNK